MRRLLAWFRRLASPVEWDDELLRRTGFWCDKHWALVVGMGVDPVEATRAITIGLALSGEPMQGKRHACCHFTDATVRGALELCK